VTGVQTCALPICEAKPPTVLATEVFGSFLTRSKMEGNYVRSRLEEWNKRNWTGGCMRVSFIWLV